MSEINTLSLAELSYQSHPCSGPVDMDTVNIAWNIRPAAVEVQLCDVPVVESGLYALHFSRLADSSELQWKQED